MAGITVVDQIQLGNNGTPANNFVIKTLNDGTMKIQRGNIGGALADILSIDLNGNVANITPYLLVRDEKPTNTSGGININGINTRVLNTIQTNSIIGASLASNQIILPAGTYRIKASAPAYAMDFVKAYLFNVTDSSNQIVGTSEDASVAGTVRCFVDGRFSIAATKVFELRHFIGTIATADGLGKACNAPGLVEVYSQVEIIKES